MSLFAMPAAKSPSKDKVKSLVDKVAALTKKQPKQYHDKLAAIKSAVANIYGDFKLIETVAELSRYKEAILDHRDFALDTETNGKHPLRNKAVGICIYVPQLPAMYAPFAHVAGVAANLPTAEIRSFLEFLYSLDKSLYIRYHAAKFDTRMVRNTFNFSGYLPIGWDTLPASHLLNENESHNLKALWSKYCGKGESAHDYTDLFEDLDFSMVPPELGYKYAAKDPLMTFELADFQKQFLTPGADKCIQQGLEKTARLYLDTELKLIPQVAKMEDTGILSDPVFCAELTKQYRIELQNADRAAQEFFKGLDYSKLSPELKGKLGNPINIGSSTQMAIIMYDVMKLKSVDRSSPRGTGEKIIKKLVFDHPELNLILDYREWQKLLSTYTEKMGELTINGRVHCQFNPSGPVTGRFSSEDPNMQNIPAKEHPEIRKMFVADEGYVLISADYSQQEPRVLTHVGRDPKMIQAYSQGLDIYAWMGSQVYKVPYEDCCEFYPDGSPNKAGKKRRGEMKVLVLAKMYGMGTKSVAESLKITLKEAERINELFQEAIPSLDGIVAQFQEHARENGFVATEFGRKRRLPEINLPEYEFVNKSGEPVAATEVNYYLAKLREYRADKWGIRQEALTRGITIKDNGGKIAEAERQALNSYVQGTSADITKRAMILIGEDAELAELNYQMLLTVHDEIIGQAPLESARAAAERKQTLMTQAALPDISVPMKVDISISKAWMGESVDV